MRSTLGARYDPARAIPVGTLAMTRVAVGQLRPTADTQENVAIARELCRDASMSGAVLLVLPELALSWRPGAPEEIAALAEPLDGPLITSVADLAAEFGLTLVAGFYERHDDDDSRPHNSLAVVAPDRGLVAVHRKTHLYDAWEYRESDEALPGAGDLVVVEVGALKVGLINCYEVRFPERAYRLVNAGADLLSVSAAWAKGPLKEEHWTLNIRARAMENTVWLAAASLLDAQCIGRSTIVDPLGVVRAELDERTAGIAVIDVDLKRTEYARSTLPILEQRRNAELVAG